MNASFKFTGWPKNGIIKIRIKCIKRHNAVRRLHRGAACVGGTGK